MKSKEALRQLEYLESEMKLIQDNIDRVREFVKKEDDDKYKPHTSHVFGELKHRLIAFKTRAAVINKLSTTNLFR